MRGCLTWRKGLRRKCLWKWSRRCIGVKTITGCIIYSPCSGLQRGSCLGTLYLCPLLKILTFQGPNLPWMKASEPDAQTGNNRYCCESRGKLIDQWILPLLPLMQIPVSFDSLGMRPDIFAINNIRDVIVLKGALT
jgi:hypothetical protein